MDGAGAVDWRGMHEETLQLSYRPPFDWPSALSFFARRAIEGVERVSDGVYRRTIRQGLGTGTIRVRHDETAGMLVASVCGVSALNASDVRARLRRMFDVDADLTAIGAALARDPIMSPLVAVRPAVRVFGGWDGFEVAARTVIGQQVSVERARRLNGVLVDRCGSRLGDARDLGSIFPTAREVLDADLSAMGMPGARVATLKSVATAALADPHLFERAASHDATIARLRAIRGVGEWTAQYVAMRACREPDAFPATDVGLLRGAADASGRRPSAAELLARAEAWRPWRAYAAHQLWAVDGPPRR